MLRLGTVFSGIGAAEHALDRLGVDYEIVFACDNGDINLFSNKHQFNYKELLLKFNSVNYYETEDSTENTDFINTCFKELETRVSEIEVDYNSINNAVDNFVECGYVSNNQILNYRKLTNNIYRCDDGISLKLEYIKLFVKLYRDINKAKLRVKDYFKDPDSVVSLYKDCDEVASKFQELRDSVLMLEERAETERIRKEVFSLTSLEEQKKYVDSLYSGFENRNKVKQSYFANYKIREHDFHWNVSFLDGTKYYRQIDLFVGGSPCQSFSLVGKQRGLDDTRGTLFYEYARLVEEIQPKVFIYENVKAVLSNDHGRTWSIMSSIFDSLGYSWSYKILNSKNYGIPQNRERLFVVGFRNDLSHGNFSFPEPIKLNSTMKDFLLDNVAEKYYLPKKGIEFVLSDKNLDKRFTQIDGDIQLCQKKNQQFNWHGDFVFVKDNEVDVQLLTDLNKYFLSDKVKKYVLSSGTKGFYSKPETDLDLARPILQSVHKMHRAGVDNYVTTCGRLRKLTPRECLRLMGFCDSFRIVVSDTAMYQQAGNSIVVDVLMNIYKEINKACPSVLNIPGKENYEGNLCSNF